jgi:hypothetical protein
LAALGIKKTKHNSECVVSKARCKITVVAIFKFPFTVKYGKADKGIAAGILNYFLYYIK